MNTRPVNVGQLVMGVALLGFVGLWAVLTGGLVDPGQLRYWLGAPWLLAGAAGLLATLTTKRRRSRPAGPAHPAYEPAHDQSADDWYERYEAERRADLAARIDAAARSRSNPTPTTNEEN